MCLGGLAHGLQASVLVRRAGSSLNLGLSGSLQFWLSRPVQWQSSIVVIHPSSFLLGV